jgi:hypothetical protein
MAYLMVFNPSAPIGLQYRLFPLGLNLPIKMPPFNTPAGEELVVDGYIIWQELVPIYKLYGANLIGPPLTDLLLNVEQNRYEQYFTNMAFYRYIDQPEGEIMLMPYGALYCAEHCAQAYEEIGDNFQTLPPDGRIPLDREMQAEVVFKNYAGFLGYDFTGEEVGEIFNNSEGQYIQIFENVVMLIDPRYLSEIQFLNLPAEVGVTPDPPEEQTIQTGYVFYPILKGKGYNIPQDIFEYVEQHGSIKVSGQPIKRVYELDTHGLGQCFEHYCLEYQPSASPGSRVRLLPLGKEYYQKLLGNASQAGEQTTLPSAMIVKVWERYPLLPSGQTQEIGVAVFEGNRPLQNVSFYLTLLLSGGTHQVHFLQPTDENGQTQIVLQPIDQPKGTMVPYQVCVVSALEGQVCFSESFLVWDEE